VDRGLGGHVALVPNPMNGTGRALPVGLVRRRELGSTGGELQLDQVTRAAEVDQVLSQDRGQRSTRPAGPKPLDGSYQGHDVGIREYLGPLAVDPRPFARAIRHSRSLANARSTQGTTEGQTNGQSGGRVPVYRGLLIPPSP